MNNAMKNKLVFGLLALLTVITLFFYTVESNYIKGLSLTTGSVSGVKSKRTRSVDGRQSYIRTTVVSYSVGSRQYSVDSRGFQIPKFSESIGVYYDPENPDNARVNRIDELYFHTLLASFFLLMSIICGLLTHFLTPFIRKVYEWD